MLSAAAFFHAEYAAGLHHTGRFVIRLNGLNELKTFTGLREVILFIIENDEYIRYR